MIMTKEKATKRLDLINYLEDTNTLAEEILFLIEKRISSYEDYPLIIRNELIEAIEKAIDDEEAYLTKQLEDL